ncbi:thiamine pyrophosphate-binding protein [Mucilaginibacter agri]|uniref:Thiamine pyrophosphate-binding protein n=1 Tax=Mucilaginibacter agri TaxID=2695265 RepID=A0A965ZIH6_9SPHI|nr:thiamine pyrophosphate-binding protein [Mucilaginibacter agri]NCD70753.1 thiamine pyrophosphate-binding protein [Mucilaginibacter agri]
MKISDWIADFLAEKEIKHVFGIIGAGNAHIFDSIQKKGYTEIICVHHEQAACMAMQTYYRTSGKVTAALLTTGAGSTNGVTGVVSAWADSIPGLVISGNENSKFVELHKDVRMWGVQGYDSALMVNKVTKYSTMVIEPEQTRYELEKAYALTTHGRPGPCWVDVPMNIQSAVIDEASLIAYDTSTNPVLDIKVESTLDTEVLSLIEKLKTAKRPLFWLGHGIKLAGAQAYITQFLDKYQIPALVTWAGIDMVDSNHPLVYGRAGTYGQRCANFVVQNCDLLICVGTRMAISQIGYDINELARDADIAVIDIDKHEIDKYEERYRFKINADAKDFLERMLKFTPDSISGQFEDWIKQCNIYRKNYPWVNSTDHPDKDGFINSYYFMDRLHNYLKADQIITTDMGTALLSGHQVLKIKDGQRLMTSTGLGEMGYGLPAAIGASIARERGEVMCLNCDGGMMMNLQELQTMVQLHLPIKLFIFNNDGYLMIKHTQNALFDGRRAGVDKKSGVSCPDFSALAKAFNIPAFQIRTWENFDTILPQVQEIDGPVICEVFMHPQQMFVPKLSLAIMPDGTLVSPPLEDLSPVIPRDELRENMIIGIHPKSENIIV